MVDRKNLLFRQRKARPRAMVGIVCVRHDHVKAVISTGQLQNNENRPVLSRNRLRHRICCHRIQHKKSLLKENWQRPRRGCTEHRGAQKFAASLQCIFRFHSSGELKLRGAHHQVYQLAHGCVARVRFPRLQELHERVDFFFCRTSPKKSHPQEIDKVVRLVAQLVGHEFTYVDGIALNLLGELPPLHRSTQAGVLRLRARRLACGQHRVAADMAFGVPTSGERNHRLTNCSALA